MVSYEDLTIQYDGIRSILYNLKNEYKAGQIDYFDYRFNQLCQVYKQIDILVQMAQLFGLPEKLIHRYVLNNDDPELQKALLIEENLR